LYFVGFEEQVAMTVSVTETVVVEIDMQFVAVVDFL